MPRSLRITRTTTIALLFTASAIIPGAGASAVSGTAGATIADTLPQTTPSLWNPRLPRLATDGTWSYTIFTRYTPDVTQRVAWVYKKLNTDTAWTYADRAFLYVHQPPGIVLDAAGRAHVVFDCMGTTCSGGGVTGSPPALRFYDLIFSSPAAGQSINFAENPTSSFLNFNEVPGAVSGYMGIASTSNGTLAALAIPTPQNSFVQNVFSVGASNPTLRPVPNRFRTSTTGVSTAQQQLYPIIAPRAGQSNTYVSVNDLFPDPDGAGSLEWQHAGARVLRLNAAGVYTQVFETTVPVTHLESSETLIDDLAYTTDGRLLVLHHKLIGTQKQCLIAVESAAGSGSFTVRNVLPTGTSERCYTQVQVNSTGRIVVARYGDDLSVQLRASTNNGQTWANLASVPVTGLPAGTTALDTLTIVKPWTSQAGYEPNRIYGLVAARNATGYNAQTTVSVAI